jgi:hypothetical protein
MIRILCALAFLTVAQPTYADTIGVTTAGGYTVLTFFDTVIGWSFTANTDVQVGALGMWDEGGDGFVEDVNVGLWTDSGTLLGLATVGSTDGLDAGFRFAAITPVLLTGGNSYTVAGLLRAPDYYRDHRIQAQRQRERHQSRAVLSGLALGSQRPTSNCWSWTVLGSMSGLRSTGHSPGCSASLVTSRVMTSTRCSKSTAVSN